MTKVASATSRYPAPARIRFVPANCPALVILVRLVSAAWTMDSPPLMAMIPKLKLTEKYPRAIGTPSLSPFCISCCIPY